MVISDEFLEKETTGLFEYLKRKTGNVSATVHILDRLFDKLIDRMSSYNFSGEWEVSVFLKMNVRELLTYYFSSQFKN